MKKKLQKACAALLILGGILLAAYPLISNYLFEHRVDSVVDIYEKQVQDSRSEHLEEELAVARQYNESLNGIQVAYCDPFSGAVINTKGDYRRLLDQSGIMCFVEIPCIDVYLPVFHGTSQEVLKKGLGHVEGTALPIGGTGNRPVISGHTGINGARLFTDLIEMKEGDLFLIHVLDEILAYRVRDIDVVEPWDISGLQAEPEADLVSLLTCTPYGINTHRLVVTGERISYTPELLQQKEEESHSTGSKWGSAYCTALAGGILLALALILLQKGYCLCRRKRKRGIHP